MTDFLLLQSYQHIVKTKCNQDGIHHCTPVGTLHRMAILILTPQNYTWSPSWQLLKDGRFNEVILEHKEKLLLSMTWKHMGVTPKVSTICEQSTSHTSHFTLRKSWVGPEPLQIFQRTGASLVPTRIRTLDCPTAHSLAIILTTLPWVYTISR
jgi:hypothetical protein